MNDNTTIHDESPARKYFTQMLNMAEDDLDPFQYRLLAHYIRWAGDGLPYPESIRQTASATKMGVNKVQSTLDELSQLGYLEIYRPTQQEARNGATITVKVLDRWLENINRYQRKPVSNSIHPVSDSTQGCIENDTPPVSKKIRLEEQKNEEQEQTRERVGVFNISKMGDKQLQAYYDQHTALIDELLLLTGVDVKWMHWGEMDLSQRRAYIRACESYLSKGINLLEYIAWLKKDLAWRKPLHVTLKDFTDNIPRYRTSLNTPKEKSSAVAPDMTGWRVPEVDDPPYPEVLPNIGEIPF